MLNYTDRWIHVLLFFTEPYSVSEDDILKVRFPDPDYFKSESKLLTRNLTLNQTMQAVFAD